MTHIISPSAASNHPFRDPAGYYALALINGPRSSDPEIAEEGVICQPIEKLGRELRPGDWVHARLSSYGLTCDIVREVVAKDGQLVLTPLVADPELQDLPIGGEVELRGFVLTYQLSRRV
jgi:hypothetical protein